MSDGLESFAEIVEQHVLERGVESAIAELEGMRKETQEHIDYMTMDGVFPPPHEEVGMLNKIEFELGRLKEEDRATEVQS